MKCDEWRYVWLYTVLKISDGSMFIPKKDTPFKVQGSSEDMESKEKRLFRAFKSRKKA